MKYLATTLAASGLVVAQDPYAIYQQCGGTNFENPGPCEAGLKCVVQNPFYHQCRPKEYDEGSKDVVTSEALQADITLDSLLASAARLQEIADANGGNRVFGSGGSNATIDWLEAELNALGTYDVYRQPFVELFSGGFATFSAGGSEYDVALMTYAPNGEASAALIPVDNLGCELSDYPSEVADSIALISRGECSFAIKAENALSAGAAGAIIYNNVPGALSGTLGGAGDYAPVVGTSQEVGNALLAAVEEAGTLEGDLVVNTILENRTTFNVIAETRGGDKSNVLVLGGHSDSVEAGPGINDDGSGIVGCLEVAKALSQYDVNNAVRFGFWSAEEFGLLGSYAYLRSINDSVAEVNKLRAYLNFDMIASPNYILGVYDGDGSAFGLTGPPGSGEIEATFQDFFTSQGEAFRETEFSGRSDYAAFLENGVPSGGLFTGAEQLKTEAEVALFGGEAGVAYDVNYHRVGDTYDNLNHDAFLINSKAIADAVAKYAQSFESLPAMSSVLRRDLAARERLRAKYPRDEHSHAHGIHAPCGQASLTE
ncbi:hypothetical protein MBLNU230_g3835t1 [Neophaeotheca triangularis]